MTLWNNRDKHAAVRSLLSLFIYLMLLLTGFSGMAHAADLAGGSLAGIQFTVHTEGDSDEVPADADKGVPHHHNSCHGHEAGQPARPAMQYALTFSAVKPMFTTVHTLDGRDSQINLRPPQI